MPGNDVPQGRLTRNSLARPVLEVASEPLGCTVSPAVSRSVSRRWRRMTGRTTPGRMPSESQHRAPG